MRYAKPAACKTCGHLAIIAVAVVSRLFTGSAPVHGTDGQTDIRIAIFLNAPLWAGHLKQFHSGSNRSGEKALRDRRPHSLRVAFGTHQETDFAASSARSPGPSNFSSREASLSGDSRCSRNRFRLHGVSPPPRPQYAS